MGSQAKSVIDGNVHRIREFELEKVNLIDEFDILQIVGEGWFGKILLVEHKATDREMVLKALPKPYTALIDFYREFHYGLHLGTHKNIITAYDVAFETAGFYVFSQEYAPLGDLTSNVSEIGIGELHTKRVARQLASALEYIHKKNLVHRDVKLDNILVFKSDFSRIKLCDFGETRPTGSVVLRRNEWLPYAAPEILEVPTDESYICVTLHDVWQFGIVIFVCLTGCLPWQKAAYDDPRYVRYASWHSSTLPMIRQPKLFKLVTSKAQRFFKRYLDPKEERRPNDLRDVYRYLDDRWMSKGMEKANETLVEEEGLCPSMYSFHSSPEEKNKLLYSLTQYGLETTVDRSAKKDRIRRWIENSVILEEDNNNIEEGESEVVLDISDKKMLLSRTRMTKKLSTETHRSRKHHSGYSRLTNERENKPLVDPRIPLENQKHQFATRTIARSTISHNNVADKIISQNSERSYLPIKDDAVNLNGNLHSHNNQTTPVKSHDKNSRKIPTNILSALPFKNVTINSNSPTTSSDSAISSDSSTVKSKPNKSLVQERKISEVSDSIQNRLKFM